MVLREELEAFLLQARYQSAAWKIRGLSVYPRLLSYGTALLPLLRLKLEASSGGMGVFLLLHDILKPGDIPPHIRGNAILLRDWYLRLLHDFPTNTHHTSD